VPRGMRNSTVGSTFGLAAVASICAALVGIWITDATAYPGATRLAMHDSILDSILVELWNGQLGWFALPVDTQQEEYWKAPKASALALRHDGGDRLFLA
jgi:hypothetical protein